MRAELFCAWLLLGCSSPAPPGADSIEPTPPPNVVIPSLAPESPGERSPPVAGRSFRSVYHITSDPPEVGVYRELGELVGLTPVTIEFRFERITRLTFLKKGYLIKSQIIEPQDGEHRLHVVLQPER